LLQAVTVVVVIPDAIVAQYSTIIVLNRALFIMEIWTLIVEHDFKADGIPFTVLFHSWGRVLWVKMKQKVKRQLSTPIVKHHGQGWHHEA
jgi:hypothetical protein